MLRQQSQSKQEVEEEHEEGDEEEKEEERRRREEEEEREKNKGVRTWTVAERKGEKAVSRAHNRVSCGITAVALKKSGEGRRRRRRGKRRRRHRRRRRRKWSKRRREDKKKEGREGKGEREVSSHLNHTVMQTINETDNAVNRP